MSRIEALFQRLAGQRAALLSFVMAGDPDHDRAMVVAEALINNGCDLLELGMPFTDPMADGLTIQGAASRALNNGHTVAKTLVMVTQLRQRYPMLPIVLMGYFNPIFRYGVSQFVNDAKLAGVDGLIIVDLPPEHDDELCLPARAQGLDFIRLLTPTSTQQRLDTLLSGASGFLYYVSVAGVTGQKAPDALAVEAMVKRIKQKTSLPICVGFGIKTPEQVKKIAAFADGVVVGSAFVECITPEKSGQQLETDIANLARTLSAALQAR